jgi:hypothetical protein
MTLLLDQHTIKHMKKNQFKMNMTTKLDELNFAEREARTANKVLPKAGLNGFDWTFVQVSRPEIGLH